jgi:hypothetical protein
MWSELKWLRLGYIAGFSIEDNEPAIVMIGDLSIMEGSIQWGYLFWPTVWN